MDLRAINGMNRTAFVAKFGGVFEHSPWVAERAFEARPFADIDPLHAAMVGAVTAATRDEQVLLLRAHPDLAGREAQDGTMTRASVAEQSSADLDQLSRTEMSRIADGAARSAHAAAAA